MDARRLWLGFSLIFLQGAGCDEKKVEISSPGPTVFYNPRNRWVDHIRITLPSSCKFKGKKKMQKKKDHQVIQATWPFDPRWLEVTVPTFEWKGHLYNHPKMGTSRITWLLFFCSVETGNFRSSTLLLWGVFALAKKNKMFHQIALVLGGFLFQFW